MATETPSKAVLLGALGRAHAPRHGHPHLLLDAGAEPPEALKAVVDWLVAETLAGVGADGG